METLSCTLDRKSFKDALAHAARVVEKRSTIPVLSHVLVIVAADLVRLVATDLDLELTAELPAATSAQGAFVLPLATLKDAVGKFKGESILIEETGPGRASLSCLTSGARVILPTLSRDEFPAIVPGDMLARFALPAESIASAIGGTLPFVSTEETRYYLQGVYMHAVCENPPARSEEHEALCTELAELREAERVALDEAGPPEGRAPEAQAQLETVRLRVEARTTELSARIDVLETERMRPDCLRFATTDGHRLGRYTLPLPEGAAPMPDGIIPTKAAKLLQSIMGKKPDRPDVRIAVNRAKVQFHYGRFAIVAKLIDGTFPDYSRVVPLSNEHKVAVPADVLALGVDSVSAIAAERTRAVAMSLDNRGEPLILTCTNAEGSRAAAIVEEGEFDSGRPDHHSIVIGFNAAYMKGILALFAGGDVSMELADPAAPMRIESPQRPELLTVLMPMRIDGAVTTRADVEAMHLNPWARLQRKAAELAKAIADVRAGTVGTAALGAIASDYIKPAIAFLVDKGQPRHIARLTVKAELAYAAGNPDAGDRALRLIEAYQRPPLPGMITEHPPCVAFASRDDTGGRDPGQDPEPDPDLDPADAAEVPESEWVTNPNYPDAPESDPMRPAAPEPEPDAAEPKTVAAVTAEPQPDAEPAQELEPAGDRLIPCVDVVKVLTLTGQALFVALDQWADDSVASLGRYHRDGQRFYTNAGPRTVLRSNIARQVLPRNRGDRPLPAVVAAPAVDGSLSERLSRLERLVGGLADAERLAALEERNRALEAELVAVTAERDRAKEGWQRLFVRRGATGRIVRAGRKMRADRTALRAQLARTEACLVDARETAGRLATRCDALERLHVDSAVLDAPAKPLNGQPTIILPLTRTSARAQ